jgi:hypothetical protein
MRPVFSPQFIVNGEIVAVAECLFDCAFLTLTDRDGAFDGVTLNFGSDAALVRELAEAINGVYARRRAPQKAAA